MYSTNNTINEPLPSTTITPNDAVEVTSFGIIPLEEKQCVKQICKRRFFGTKAPPEVKVSRAYKLPPTG